MKLLPQTFAMMVALGLALPALSTNAKCHHQACYQLVSDDESSASTEDSQAASDDADQQDSDQDNGQDAGSDSSSDNGDVE